MTNEEKQKAISALKLSAPVKAMTQEEFKDYIQTLNKIMDWLEQESETVTEQRTGYWIKIGDKGLGYNDIVKCKCSECGFKKEFPGKFDGQKLIVDMEHAYKHCPDCGVPMVEQKAESYMATKPTTIYKKLKLTDDDI